MPNTTHLDNPVTHPNHYTQSGIEVIDFIVAWKMSFLQGNVIKYVTRYQLKGGVEDLKKAAQYLAWLIELESKDATSRLSDQRDLRPDETGGGTTGGSGGIFR